MMKKYEKPSVDIKRFEVEDVMAISVYEENNKAFEGITQGAKSANGVVFQW